VNPKQAVYADMLEESAIDHFLDHFRQKSETGDRVDMTPVRQGPWCASVAVVGYKGVLYSGMET